MNTNIPFAVIETPGYIRSLKKLKKKHKEEFKSIENSLNENFHMNKCISDIVLEKKVALNDHYSFEPLRRFRLLLAKNENTLSLIYIGHHNDYDKKIELLK